MTLCTNAGPASIAWPRLVPALCKHEYPTYARRRGSALRLLDDFASAFAPEARWRDALSPAARRLLGRMAARPEEARLCFQEVLRGDHELLRRRDGARRKMADLFVGELGRRRGLDLRASSGSFTIFAQCRLPTKPGQSGSGSRRGSESLSRLSASTTSSSSSEPRWGSVRVASDRARPRVSARLVPRERDRGGGQPDAQRLTGAPVGGRLRSAHADTRHSAQEEATLRPKCSRPPKPTLAERWRTTRKCSESRPPRFTGR